LGKHKNGESMKNLFIALIAVITISGCSALETLGDYVNENQLFADIATRQAVGRYIAAGDTIEAEKSRALQVETRLERILRYVDGNPSATTGGLMSIIEKSIDWGELEPADRLLVTDILTLLNKELDQYEGGPKLSDTAQIAIRGLFETAMSAARVYLLR